MNLALCCDLRLAARRARFDSRFLQLALHPGGGNTSMMPQVTNAIVLFGEVLDGAEAERIGLVWRCVDDDRLLDEARTLAGRAAADPPGAGQDDSRDDRRRGEHRLPSRGGRARARTELWSLNQPAFAARLAALRRRSRARQSPDLE